MPVEEPMQMDLLLPADAVGFEFTVTVADEVAVQLLLSVTVTV